jgi:hypothetical protein
MENLSRDLLLLSKPAVESIDEYIRVNERGPADTNRNHLHPHGGLFSKAGFLGR